MSQDLFCSVYTRDYKWLEYAARPPLARGANIAEDPKKYEKFLSPQELKPGEDSADAIRHLHQLWWKTSYRVHFCEDRFPPADPSLEPLQEDLLMASLEREFTPSTRKLLPPPDTNGVVFGFCPERHFRSSRSFYTDAHTRPAFEQLRQLVLERGTSRMDMPPVRYTEPDYSTPPCRQGKALPKATWIHRRPDPYS